jgi:hypothetical protein
VKKAKRIEKDIFMNTGKIGIVRVIGYLEFVICLEFDA